MRKSYPVRKALPPFESLLKINQKYGFRNQAIAAEGGVVVNIANWPQLIFAING